MIINGYDFSTDMLPPYHKGNICSNFSMYKELPEDGYMW